MRPTAVTVIGAGPAGSLLGCFLARRGFAPTLHERRPDMRRAHIAAGRSINLALADRGIHALRRAGVLDAVRPLMIPMRGRLLHDLNGAISLQPYGKDASEVIHSVSRGELNKLLMSEFERASGTAIRFNRNCRGMDLGRGVLTIRDEESGTTQELADTPVIAADGASSALRDSMVAAGLATATEDLLSHRYKELSIAAGAAGRHQIDSHALHIWPRGGFMLIALPNTDGSFTATLFLPATGPESFATLDSPRSVTDFFARHFPDVLPLIPDLEEDFFSHPTGTMVTVRCAPWRVGGDLLLIGDAAHGIVPFHGQGMNCAFEDCARLDELLDRHEQWDGLFAEFERDRKPNADAIAAMALENYIEMRDTVRHPKFQLQKALSLELERRFPRRFIPRYSMVMFHHEIPYATALARGRVQQELLDELSAGTDRVEQIDWERAARLVRASLPEF
ncbi:MAG TPA: NAD(P)/FAD-dependent oxidoreductase [Steroidobacteraceae bacterium]|nr:NAD(P)/FAD-dependent oxidoreductase [Steroidobacteraceae bacterium]